MNSLFDICSMNHERSWEPLQETFENGKKGIPSDVWKTCIFSRLDPRSVLRCAKVCHAWRVWAMDNEVCSRIFAKYFTTSTLVSPLESPYSRLTLHGHWQQARTLTSRISIKGKYKGILQNRFFFFEETKDRKTYLKYFDIVQKSITDAPLSPFVAELNPTPIRQRASLSSNKEIVLYENNQIEVVDKSKRDPLSLSVNHLDPAFPCQFCTLKTKEGDTAIFFYQQCKNMIKYYWILWNKMVQERLTGTILIQPDMLFSCELCTRSRG